MSDKVPRFNVHDTKIVIWTEISSDRNLYDKIRRTLKRQGFSWMRDPYIVKHYPILAPTRHYGCLKGLEFCAEIHPAMIELVFFQNFVTVNQHGGKHDFDKLKKMPYLIRLRYQKAMNAIRALLLKEGFADNSKVTHKSAIANVMQHRKELEDFQGKGFYTRERQSYNITDGDRVALKDGDARYFYDYNNRLSKATVYHNINNMWWAVINESSYTNVCSTRLFSWKPGLPRRKHPKPESRIKALLDDATRRMDFERAIVYRDLLKASSPAMLEASVSG